MSVNLDSNVQGVLAALEPSGEYTIGQPISDNNITILYLDSLMKNDKYKQLSQYVLHDNVLVFADENLKLSYVQCRVSWFGYPSLAFYLERIAKTIYRDVVKGIPLIEIITKYRRSCAQIEPPINEMMGFELIPPLVDKHIVQF
jgi:hypothetical protein